MTWQRYRVYIVRLDSALFYDRADLSNQTPRLSSPHIRKANFTWAQRLIPWKSLPIVVDKTAASMVSRRISVKSKPMSIMTEALEMALPGCHPNFHGIFSICCIIRLQNLEDVMIRVPETSKCFRNSQQGRTRQAVKFDFRRTISDLRIQIIEVFYSRR